MELLAILIALVLLQVWGSGGPVQRDEWFWVWRGRIERVPEGTLRSLCVVLLPVLGVGLLHRILHGMAYGFPELLLFTVILLYSLGRGDISADVAEYLQRWERADFQAAFEQIQAQSGNGVTETSPADAWELHASMRRHYLYRVHERLFAVIFWFTVLGPAGALAYRLLRLECSRIPAEGNAASDVMYWADWVPARINAIAYALTGNFDACVDAWRAHAFSVVVSGARLIESCGLASLGFSSDRPADADQESVIRKGVDEIDAIETLQRRSLVLWIAVISVLLIRF